MIGWEERFERLAQKQSEEITKVTGARRKMREPRFLIRRGDEP